MVIFKGKAMKTLITLIITVWLFSSCNKQNEWLDVKSNKSDVILSTAADYQAVLDNFFIFNSHEPSFGMLCTDNITADLALWQGANETHRNAYIFAKEILGSPSSQAYDWTPPYQNIANCNIVIEGIQKIKNEVLLTEYNNILGSALFLRANNYFSLTQHFTVPYNNAASNSSLGVPIRKTTDVNEKSVRPILKENYDNILDDLKNAEKLLPDLPSYQTRPSKASALALLARVYLTMGEYEESLSCAEKALSIYSELIDYNTLKVTDEFVFPTYPKNIEVILFAGSQTAAPLFRYQTTHVDLGLYNLYGDNDLRKSLFFKKGSGNIIQLKGQYTGEYSPFAGFATNELYLMKAECQARLKFTESSMETLNLLLRKRWRKDTFVPLVATESDEALQTILNERRKEIPFLSNIRWQDLRRLNQDPRFAKTVVHTLDGVDYILEPNSPRYVFDIPYREIEYSGIQQNLR